MIISNLSKHNHVSTREKFLYECRYLVLAKNKINKIKSHTSLLLAKNHNLLIFLLKNIFDLQKKKNLKSTMYIEKL